MVRENFRYREVMVTMNFTARVHVAGLLALALAGCYDGLGRQDSMSGTGSVSVSVTGITAGPTEVTGASGPTEAGESGTAGVTGSGGSTQSSSGGESSGGAPKFDLGEQPTVDLGGEMMGPIIPTTCAEASSGKSTVGCKFFAVDMDAHDQVETSQYAVGVAACSWRRWPT